MTYNPSSFMNPEILAQIRELDRRRADDVSQGEPSSFAVPVPIAVGLRDRLAGELDPNGKWESRVWTEHPDAGSPLRSVTQGGIGGRSGEIGLPAQIPVGPGTDESLAVRQYEATLAVVKAARQLVELVGHEGDGWTIAYTTPYCELAAAVDELDALEGGAS